ncbi:MAG TPA: biotin-dependent carboxyltransferase family protein [Candidatus Binataceae bacterium]|jgi:biotin-dependent carboxylase-like uncharacterized protein|nr:biotin-dependent carboxyltransferase family protein [Candidatus Binataceae bacterium]
MLKVLRPGLLTTVQDAGRFGWYHIGMPPAGAMDQFSFRAGNLLVGNDEGAAALETTFLGPELEAGADLTVAVTGAPLELRLNGAPAPMWVALELKKGDRLECGQALAGVRSYVCVAGEIDVPELLGSRSTYLLGRFGGLGGRALAKGDALRVGEPRRAARELTGRRLDPRLLPTFPEVAELRILMGLCGYRLTEDSAAQFLETTWTVSTEADRIGYRIQGVEFSFRQREQPFGAGSDPSNVVDVGYPVGSIQVPGGKEGILLMRDAVTGGGYATIGTVLQCDLDRVAQAAPRARLRFRAVTIREALQIRAQYRARLRALADSLALFDSVGWLGQ